MGIEQGNRGPEPHIVCYIFIVHAIFHMPRRLQPHFPPGSRSILEPGGHRGDGPSLPVGKLHHGFGFQGPPEAVHEVGGLL